MAIKQTGRSVLPGPVLFVTEMLDTLRHVGAGLGLALRVWLDRNEGAAATVYSPETIRTRLPQKRTPC